MNRAFLVLLGVTAFFGASAGDPTWTPDAADVIFTSNREGNGEIFLIAAGGQTWVNLTNNPGGDNWPEWSPDGKRILFQTQRHGKLDLYVMDADGSNQRRLTDHEDHDYLGSWSPDGTKIFFASWRQEPGDSERKNHIYSMNADGSEQRRFLLASLNTSAGIQWSAKGDRFVTERIFAGETADLVICDQTGKQLERLTEGPDYCGSPAWSPDGKQLAYYGDDTKDAKLVILNLETKTTRTLLTAGKNWYPRWSPDGNWLVYTVQKAEGDLAVMALKVDGSAEPRVVADSPSRDLEGRWKPGH